MMTIKEGLERRALLTTAHLDHEKALNKYAFFKSNDKAKSEDMVQDTFMKAWSYLIKGGKILMMKAFLYHILNNIIIDQYRKHKTISLDDLMDKGFDPGENHVEQDLDFLDGKAAILLIKFLPANYQRVMNMRYVKMLSIQEIAEITGQSRNAVAVQAHRGIVMLRTLYKRLS